MYLNPGEGRWQHFNGQISRNSTKLSAEEFATLSTPREVEAPPPEDGKLPRASGFEPFVQIRIDLAHGDR